MKFDGVSPRSVQSLSRQAAGGDLASGRCGTGLPPEEPDQVEFLQGTLKDLDLGTQSYLDHISPVSRLVL
ncbi:MAG: hypothetical protein AMXMBFR33_32570 [Candidatus Xenobia bacterium]